MLASCVALANGVDICNRSKQHNLNMKRQQNKNVKNQAMHHWRAPKVVCPLLFLSGDIPLMNVGYR